MSVIEKSACVRYKDADGNLITVYPVTKVENVIGLDKISSKTVVNDILLASNWRSGVYVWNRVDIESPNQTIELVPAPTITADQLEALQTANIVGTAQAVGSVTMTAFGEVPTIDIPVTFIVRGDA